MSTVNWEKKYYELLEKHNDQLDELLLVTSMDAPSIVVFIKFYGPWTRDVADDFINVLKDKIGLPVSRIKFIYALIGAGQAHDVTVEMFPIRKYLTGEIDCDHAALGELLNSTCVEYKQEHIPF